MRDNGQYLLRVFFLKSIGSILFLGYCFTITPAEATVNIRSFMGTVEVLFEGEQVWKPFADPMKLDAGDQIRTGQNSSVDLVCEDGSELHLGEDTQLAISELEFSLAQKTWVSRFKLFWGAVTAKAGALEFNEKSFKIETDTVIVAVKSSEGIIAASRNEPRSDVFVMQGLFEIQQTGKGLVNVSGLVDNQEGIAFPLDLVGARILLNVQKRERKITLESNTPLPSIRALIGNYDNILEVKNVSGASLHVSFQGNIATLDQEEIAIFEVPANQEISIETTGKTNAIFWFRRLVFPKTQPSRERYSPQLAPKQTIESPILPE